MREEVKELWPELEWIGNEELRESTLMTWMRAFEHSPLTPADLQPAGAVDLARPRYRLLVLGNFKWIQWRLREQPTARRGCSLGQRAEKRHEYRSCKGGGS